MNAKSRFNISKIIKYFFIIVSLLPFIQTSYQIFNPTINNITTILKVMVVIYSTFIAICYHKKIDNLILAVFICNSYMIIPTYINNGYFIKFFGYFIDSIGLLFVIKHLNLKYGEIFLDALKIMCRIMIYLNLILLFLYPNGIYAENNGYLTTRYLLLGMDNQAVSVIIPFMIIIYAISKYQNKIKNSFFYLDIIVFLASIILIWCGNSIVGIGFFIIALFYQKIFKRKLTIKSSLYILIFLSVFIVFLQGFKIFSVFIIDFLGKDLTLSGRTTIWSNGIREWLKYPIIGHGFQVSEAFITFSNASGYVRGAHNQILNILLHGGIIYLLLFAIVFIIIHKITKKYKNNEFINILILGILSYLIMGIADTYGHQVGLYILVGVLCYCGIEIAKKGRSEDNEK